MDHFGALLRGLLNALLVKSNKIRQTITDKIPSLKFLRLFEGVGGQLGTCFN